MPPIGLLGHHIFSSGVVEAGDLDGVSSFVYRYRDTFRDVLRIAQIPLQGSTILHNGDFFHRHTSGHDIVFAHRQATAEVEVLRQCVGEDGTAIDRDRSNALSDGLEDIAQTAGITGGEVVIAIICPGAKINSVFLISPRPIPLCITSFSVWIVGGHGVHILIKFIGRVAWISFLEHTNCVNCCTRIFQRFGNIDRFGGNLALKAIAIIRFTVGKQNHNLFSIFSSALMISVSVQHSLSPAQTSISSR